MSISNRFRVAGLALPLTAISTRPAWAQDAAPTGDTWPTDGWAIANPDDQGLPSDLADQIDARVASETPLLSALLVVRGGQLVVERYYNGFQADETFAVWSVAKSITTIAAGVAFRDGLFSGLDQTLGELMPDRIPAEADPRVQDITLQHLLTSTSGWEWDGRINFRRHDETDDLDLALTRPMICDPGDCFEYDNTNTNLLSYLIGTMSGGTMAEYLQPRLFDPLGIAPPEWLVTEDGANRGAGGLLMTPGDLTKLGYLYLNGGAWDGEQIVDEEWVTASTIEQVSGTSSTSGVNISNDATYGYQWWITETSDYPVFYGNGYGGQTLYVVPDLDLVVTTAVAGTDVNAPENQQPVMPIIEELIVPAAIGG